MPALKLFSAKIRRGGDVRDEVRKDGLTAAEIKMLKKIHGKDAVLEVDETGVAQRDVQDERKRLEMLYGEKAVAAVFGAPVPTMEDDEIEDDPTVKIEESIRRSRTVRQSAPLNPME
jgi:hypothetical protein